MPDFAPATLAAPDTTKGERTRAVLIEAAHDLFLRHGCHGTSMRQIAEKAGLALGGIYNHFDNKEEIFAAVLDAYHPYHRILPALDSAEGETIELFVRDSAEKMRAAALGQEAQILPLLFVELVEFQGRHLGQLAQRLLPSLAAYVSRFAGKRGRLRAVPLPVMIRTFLGLFISFIITEMILKTIPVKNAPLLRDQKMDWFGGMVDIYLHGILEPEG